MKRKLVVGLAVAIGCAVAGIVVVRRQASPQAARQTVKAERRADLERAGNQARPAAAPVEAPGIPDQSTPEQATTFSASMSQTQSVRADSQNNVRKQAVAVAPKVYQSPGLAGSSIPEPLARAALSYVGADPDAEAVWVQAINDPRLSADARQNLIEDLNEDGFPDPENPTSYDLPLIVSRIALIEQLAPDAMDDVNAAAFQEAYKDLVNMYARVTGS